MAAGIMQQPGSQYGPCPKPCEHDDCRDTRELAATPCARCGAVIGFGVRFYHLTGTPGYAHAACEEIRTERPLRERDR